MQYGSSIIRNFLFIFSFFTLSKSLTLSDNSSAAIPELASQINKIPGGYFPVENPETLNSFVVQSMVAAEKIDGSPKRHKLLKIRQAISQVVAGTNYKAVVTVGEVGPDGQVDSDGQYGLCYFEMFLPLGENPLEISDHKCVKINKNDALIS
uniref:Cystatin domain-containing protein n=1 Tax=Romanomermis culicivorax TaxID=13658 RepID=A0A915JQW0_ROMCU